jgi:hypothetical protein
MGSQTPPRRLDSERPRRAGRFITFAIDQATFALSLVWPKRVRAGGSRECPSISLLHGLLSRTPVEEFALSNSREPPAPTFRSRTRGWGRMSPAVETSRQSSLSGVASRLA